jgi:hypothetical protein
MKNFSGILLLSVLFFNTQPFLFANLPSSRASAASEELPVSDNTVFKWGGIQTEPPCRGKDNLTLKGHQLDSYESFQKAACGGTCDDIDADLPHVSEENRVASLAKTVTEMGHRTAKHYAITASGKSQAFTYRSWLCSRDELLFWVQAVENKFEVDVVKVIANRFVVFNSPDPDTSEKVCRDFYHSFTRVPTELEVSALPAAARMQYQKCLFGVYNIRKLEDSK